MYGGFDKCIFYMRPEVSSIQCYSSGVPNHTFSYTVRNKIHENRETEDIMYSGFKTITGLVLPDPSSAVPYGNHLSNLGT